MSKPKREFSTVSHQVPPQRRSLNGGIQRKAWQQIEVENAKILQRIMDQKSFYDFGKARSIKRPSKRIIIRKTPKQEEIQVIRNQAPSQAVTLERMLKIDGVPMLVKIVLTRHSLTIEGAT